MKIFKNKILLSVFIVIFIVITPSFIFSIYQYSTITDEEKVIDEVYKNQLESILFSINQYAVDITDVWVNKINEIYSSSGDSNNGDFQEFLQQNDVLKQFNIVEINTEIKINLNVSKLNNKDQLNARIIEYLKNNPDKSNELLGFLKNDYQKMEGIQFDSNPEFTSLIFGLRTGNKPQLGILTINTEQFIMEGLSPKIQEIAEGKMNILIFNNKENRLVYSNIAVNDNLENIQKSKELWLLPNYSLGIRLTGNTLNDLVEKRVRIVILLVILFNVLIIFGIWFLYYNVKKEMELAKIKSDFVSNVSHELRTPLAMISMYSETLMMDRIKDEQKKKEYYEVIQLETNRLNGIVNNILSFSRIENNKREYHFRSEYLNKIIDEVIHVYKHELQNKGFQVIVNKNDELSKIYIDRDAVKEAIINLISNSIKYSDENKYLEITTSEDNIYQYIELSDKGVGINEKDQKHIFDKFYRVSEGNLAYKAQGSGLGLSIVKHIMDAHNGQIEVKSKIGEGAKFKLIFPKESKT